jgi:hypothetical protein
VFQKIGLSPQGQSYHVDQLDLGGTMDRFSYITGVHLKGSRAKTDNSILEKTELRAEMFF